MLITLLTSIRTSFLTSTSPFWSSSWPSSGGGGSWLGPVIGAVLLTLINEGLSTFVRAELARIIYGGLFIIVTIYMPNDIIDFFRKRG